MDGWIGLIVKINPSYFAFLSGILVSSGLNLITSRLVEKDITNKMGSIGYISILLFLAGVFFMILSWSLEEPFRIWKTANRELGWSEADITSIAFGESKNRIWLLFILAILFLLISIVIIFIEYK